MTPLTAPDGLKLAPQEWRVFAVLHDWADRRAIERAINDPDGHQRYSPAAVILAKLKGKITPFGLTIEREERAHTRRWRVVRVEPAEQAA